MVGSMCGSLLRRLVLLDCFGHSVGFQGFALYKIEACDLFIRILACFGFRFHCFQEASLVRAVRLSRGQTIPRVRGYESRLISKWKREEPTDTRTLTSSAAA